MPSTRRIKAVFKKQFLDKGGLRAALFQVMFYPVLLFMFSLSGEKESTVALVLSLAPMLIGSSPMLLVYNIVREDKNSGTLRALMLASVKPIEYMIGISAFLITITTCSSIVIGMIGELGGFSLVQFVISSMMGSTLTVMLGCALSLRKNSKTNAIMLINVISVINGFIPMLEMFYPSIYKVTKFWYTQQVKNIILSIYSKDYSEFSFSFAMIFINLIVFIGAFLLIYRKNRIFSQE
jgi:hypothetical protein